MIVVIVLYKIYSNKAVKYQVTLLVLPHSIQCATKKQPLFHYAAYLLASSPSCRQQDFDAPLHLMYIIDLCIDCVLFLLQIYSLGTIEGINKGTCNLHDEEAEVNNIGHNFASKSCHLKVVGIIICDCLCKNCP